MPCYSPLKGYYSKSINPSGKRSIVFSTMHSYDGKVLEIPCGQCIGCRLKRSRDWAVRCLHEATLHASNCFITLTYSEANLPADLSIDVREFQLFMKRLRKKHPGVRYFHCGEYGSQSQRPHYHAILFGVDFPDKVVWKRTSSSSLIYRSATLEALWPLGYSSIGDVTFESAAYVARYIMKKVTGPMADDYYSDIDPDTGEITRRKPEYTTMSLKPGIGRGWIEKHAGDVGNHDFVMIDGRRLTIPRYYDKFFERENIDVYADLKDRRVDASLPHRWNNTPERLAVREEIQLSKLARLKRNLGD